jgi:hypothetical protein
MKYVPKTEEELAGEALLPEGVYDFEVLGTDDKPSKKGNDMITLKLRVFSDEGEQYIYDYIALGSTFGERKLRHAAATCGLLKEYNSGTINADSFNHACGRVKIKQQAGTDDYPLPKNTVADYVDRAPAPDTRPSEDIISDNIPF